MRFRYFSLALYLLTLAVYPCYEANCETESTIVISTALGSEKDHEESCEDCGTCSPFCLSSCCPVHIFYSDGIDISNPGYPQDHIAHYVGDSVPEITFSIWQPPKIA